MTLWRLVTKEILHRKLNFGLGLVSVIVAVGCLVGALFLLRAHDSRTSELLQQHDERTVEILAEKEAQTKERMRKLNDDMRKITKQLGFNIYIFPEGQDWGKVLSEGYAEKTMPESYVMKLAKSRLMTINHLLPSLTQKIKWPEQGRTILLTGIRGEVPIQHRGLKKPLLDPVPPGSIVLGYELHNSLKLKVNDKVKLMGQEFKVKNCYKERGHMDDITAWIDLAQAQKLLKKEGLINAIWALECNCSAKDRLGAIRKEVGKILPNTVIKETGSKALARAEARNRAKKEAIAALAQEKDRRASLRKERAATRLKHRDEREQFASILIPLVIIGSAVWIGFLAFSNVRDRRQEIGVMRALGVRSTFVLFVFLTKAILIGFVGAAAGYGVGLAVATNWGEMPAASDGSFALFDPKLLLLVLALAPLLAVVASWIPALLASQQDPAVVLREE